MKIFLQKDEDVFEKYGDEEAALYNMMLEMEKQEKAQKAKERAERQKDGTDRGDDRRDNRDRGDRDGGHHGKNRRHNNERHDDYGKPATKEDAQALGINFSNSGGPPKFVNKKKKENDEIKKTEDPVRTVSEVDESSGKQKGDLREIIELEKQKSYENK